MNRFVIADAKNCIGCRACEVACVMAHNHGEHVLTPAQFQPRIHVLKLEHKHTAVLCRHCEDAPCANVCPNHAIEKRDNSIQVIQEKCIGCKTCVVACPFGAMEVITQPAPTETLPEGVIANAHKCDLCAGVADAPSCVASCPSNALKLIDDETLNNLRRQRQLRAMMNDDSGLLFDGSASKALQSAAPIVMPNRSAKPSKVPQMLSTPARHDPVKNRLRYARQRSLRSTLPLVKKKPAGKPAVVCPAEATACVNGHAHYTTAYRIG